VDPVTADPAARPLAGKTAVVTGTAHGIGTAIAEALRGDGAAVHGVDKDDVDLTDAGAVRDFFAGLGGADILVNNAGGVVGQVGHPLEHVSEQHWLEVLHANLTTNFLCTRAVVPVMKERRWGRIVNISSAAGLTVSKTGIQAYTSAKAGVIGFTRQMAAELGPFGVTVNCIAPGFIRSNPTTERQWESYGEEGQRQLIAGIATRRLGEPEDIANGVRFFVSPRSSWVTGQVIAIDGGSAFL
jgi:3-oxoacyl-[acyl-carrier protein] reductase